MNHIRYVQDWIDHKMIHHQWSIDNIYIGSFYIEVTEDDQAILSGIYIAEEERGKGYTHMMMEEAIKELRQLNLPTYLIVLKTNFIIKTYEAIGFIYDGDYSDNNYQWMKLKEI